MRIAAGVLLIIVGIMNGIAGSGYALAGGAGAAVEAAAESGEATKGMNAEQKAEFEKNMKEAKEKMGGATAGLGILGIFLLVMLGLQIAGAVTLFMSKAAKFVMLVAVLGVVAELAGPLAFGVGFGVTNILGIVAAVLAFLAARAYAGGGGAVAAA